MRLVYLVSMFTSSADVFRTRQATADLLAYARSAPAATMQRLTAGFPPGTSPDALLRFLSPGAGNPSPWDDATLSAVALAAALPDDDFPVFMAANALLLIDALRRPSDADDLFWQWEAFHAQIALADPIERGLLVVGFRAMAAARDLVLDPPIARDLAHTRSRDEVLAELAASGQDVLIRALLSDPAAPVAGELWERLAPGDATTRMAIRYLYERPEGLAPSDPEIAPLLPWPPD